MFNFLSRKDIKFASAGSVVVKFGSTFFVFLNAVLLARYLSVEGFGVYILAYSTMMLVTSLVTMGMPHLMTRYVSKYEVHSNYSAIKGLVRKTNFFAIGATLVVFLIAFISYYLWWSRYDLVLVETILYGLALVPLLGLGALRNGTLRGMKLIVLADVPDTLFRNAMFTICIVAAILFELELTPQLTMLFQLLAASLGFILGFFFLWKKLLRKIREYSAVYHTREWMKQAFPFTVNNVVQVAKLRSITYILAIFGSIEAVAIFEVASRGAALVSFVLDTLNMAIAPFVSAAHEEGDMPYIQRIVRKTSRIIFLFSVVVASVFFIGGPGLLQWVFGTEYFSSYLPLVALCIGQLLNAIVGSVGLVLRMTGYQRIHSNTNVIALVATLAAGIPMIIYFDALGAAIVVSIVLIVQNLFLLNFVRKHLRINTTIFYGR